MKRTDKPVPSQQFTARIAALATPEAPPRPRIMNWQALAASLLVTAFLSSTATYYLASGGGNAIEQTIADSHRRSLLAASPTDIASSDRHTVRPWFEAKLGLSPPTIDLAEAGFPLVGGRVEVIGGKPEPVLVYRRRQHLITLAAIPLAPGEANTPAHTKVVEGYNMVQWDQSGFGYWAVSDLDAPELKTFVDDLRSK